MTWYLSTQIYSMPSVLDLTSECNQNYNAEQFVCQNDHVFTQGVNHQELTGTGYNPPSFSYLSPESEVSGYCQQQYPANNHNQQSYRDNSFVWIGTNNFYPSSSYDQRYTEDCYNIPRQSDRRHANGDRSEKTSGRKRRAPTVAQRRAANIRERRRMYNLNEAFDCLRQRIPTFAYEKRLSRIETLRLAISYISFMARIVNGEDPSTLRVNTYITPLPSSSSMSQPKLCHDNSIPTSNGCDNDEFDEERDEYDEDEDEEEDGVDGDVSGAEEDGIVESGRDIRGQDNSAETRDDTTSEVSKV